MSYTSLKQAGTSLAVIVSFPLKTEPELVRVLAWIWEVGRWRGNGIRTKIY